MRLKKVLAVLLSVVLLLQGSLFTTVFAVSPSDFTDFPDNWSSPALEAAVENGLLQGDSNGKLKPDSLLTRAQLAVILTRAFGAEQTASLSDFTDIPKAHWAYDAISRAVAAGFLTGSGENMYPDREVTRQETMVVLARALNLENNTSALASFSDAVSVSDWAKGPAGAMISAGYINGNNGNIDPDISITRAQFAQIMANISKTYLASKLTYSTDVEGGVIINTPGVTLQNMIVGGDVIIADGAGTGDAFLSDVTIKGRLAVRGSSSIYIKNSNIAHGITLYNANGTTRVVISGSTVGRTMYVSSDLTLEGNVENLILKNPVSVNIKSGTVGLLQLEDTAANSNITVSSGAKVIAITVEGSGSTISGSGRVDTVNVNADNVKISTPDTKVTVASDAIGVTAGGKTVEGGKSVTINSTGNGLVDTPTSSGGSGGGSSDYTNGFSGGRGTASSPWQISTADQLNAVRNDLTAHYVLSANIDLSQSAYADNWMPIGAFKGTDEDPDMPVASNAFTGTFDGGGCTISRLKIADTSTVRGVGLFGCTANEAVIRNLNVEDAEVSSVGAGIAAVVGMAMNTNDKAIQNVTLSGTNKISGIMMVGGIIGGGSCGIDNCTASADVVLTSKMGNSAGILAGGMSDNFTSPSITNCTVNGGTIKIEDDSSTDAAIAVIGGLTGCATDFKAITDCTVSNVTITVPAGSIMIGGLTGAAGKTTEGMIAEYAGSQKSFTLIENCTVSAVINGGGASRVGGIIGSGFYYTGEAYEEYYPVPAAVQIVNCTAKGTISGEEIKNVGAIIGYAFHNSVVTSCTSTDLIGAAHQIGAADAAAAVALNGVDAAGQTIFKRAASAINHNNESSYEINSKVSLANEDNNFALFDAGDGTASSPWQISTADQLDAVRNDLTAHYLLTANIDLSQSAYADNWVPIGAFKGTDEDPDMPVASNAFTGTFNGGSCTLSNLKIADTSTVRGVGLFGCTANEAVIKNLNVENAAVSSTGSGIAAVVGMAMNTNDKAIQNVTLSGNNKISGIMMVGGIIGGGSCGIDNCTASADIVLISKMGNSAGILAGGMSDNFTSPSITNCTVTGGTIKIEDDSNTDAAVAVIGGLTGCATDFKAITDCTVSNVTITVPAGSIMIGGLVGSAGKTTEGMIAEYAGSQKSFTLIEDCTVSAVINAGGASRVGGIIGSGFYYTGEAYEEYYPVPAAVQIVNCTAGGTIFGEEIKNVGAIIGYAFHNSVVTSCISTDLTGAAHQIGAADAAAVVALNGVDARN